MVEPKTWPLILCVRRIWGLVVHVHHKVEVNLGSKCHNGWKSVWLRAKSDGRCCPLSIYIVRERTNSTSVYPRQVVVFWTKLWMDWIIQQLFSFFFSCLSSCRYEALDFDIYLPPPLNDIKFDRAKYSCFRPW